MKDVYSNTYSDTHVVPKDEGHLQLRKILKDLYSNTNSDSACSFEKGRTLSVKKEMERHIFEYK